MDFTVVPPNFETTGDPNGSPVMPLCHLTFSSTSPTHHLANPSRSSLHYSLLWHTQRILLGPSSLLTQAVFAVSHRLAGLKLTMTSLEKMLRWQPRGEAFAFRSKVIYTLTHNGINAKHPLFRVCNLASVLC